MAHHPYIGRPSRPRGAPCAFQSAPTAVSCALPRERWSGGGGAAAPAMAGPRGGRVCVTRLTAQEATRTESNNCTSLAETPWH
eukprot:494639-Prymnesium_polylepis.1